MEFSMKALMMDGYGCGVVGGELSFRLLPTRWGK